MSIDISGGVADRTEWQIDLILNNDYSLDRYFVEIGKCFERRARFIHV